MPNYVTLLGAEDVQKASSRMIEAAERMERAASQIEYALERHAEQIEIGLCRPTQPQEDESDA